MRSIFFFALAIYASTNAAFAQDANLGKTLFQECAACHSTKPGETLTAPSLAGIYGRKAGTSDGFRYTNAMKRSGITWNEESLDAYLADPQAAIPGNRMPYSGMANSADRKNLIAYLKTI